MVVGRSTTTFMQTTPGQTRVLEQVLEEEALAQATVPAAGSGAVVGLAGAAEVLDSMQSPVNRSWSVISRGRRRTRTLWSSLRPRVLSSLRRFSLMELARRVRAWCSLRMFKRQRLLSVRSVPFSCRFACSFLYSEIPTIHVWRSSSR